MGISLFCVKKRFSPPLRVISILSMLTMTFFSLHQAQAQCAAPSSLGVTSITNDKAKVTWTLPVGGATAYSWFVYNPQGIAVTEGTGSLTTANVTGLNPATTYTVMVQSICLGGTLSNPLGPVTFTTGCAPIGVPYTQNLTTTALNSLPACWTTKNLVTTNAATWKTINLSSNKAFAISKSVMNDWLFTGAFNLEAGVPYTVSFAYRGYSSIGGTLALYQGTTPTPTDMNTSPLVNISLTTQSNIATSTFIPNTTGVYYFGWKATRNSGISNMTMTIDDISIVPQGCVNAPVITSITGVVANMATANWANIAGTAGYDWKVVLQGTGVGAQAVAEGSVGAGVTTVTATNLPAGDYYDFYIRAKCGTLNTSNWSSPMSFQTLAQAELVASTDNDAYIGLHWALPVAPCLLNGAGQPYPQGVHLSLKDASNNQEIYATNISDLSDYVGNQQPAFSAVLTGGGAGYSVGAGMNSSNDISFWTLETWVNHGSGLANALLFSNKLNGTNQVKIKFVNAQQVQIELGPLNTVYAFAVGNPAVIPAGKWAHIAFVSNGGKVQLYVNGEFQSEKDIATVDRPYLKLKNTTSGVAPYTLFENYTNGQVGEMRLWRRVRTATEIKNDRFLTTISNVAQNDLVLWGKWNTSGGATTLLDVATVADGAANITGTMPTIAYVATPDYTPIIGNFKHYVGPNQNRNYVLNVYEMGSGIPTTACSALTATGSTIAYQPPVQFAATDNQLNKVTLSWVNKSKLSESIKIYRDGVLYKIIPGTEELDATLTYDDIYTDGDSTSLVSGKVYNYCIEAYSNILNYTAPSQQCDAGATIDIHLTATDDAFPDKVVLNWNSVAIHGYTLQILRGGQTIASLPPSATTYSDETPIYGKRDPYKLALINTANNGAVVIAAIDTGSVAARGAISGRVSTNEGDYPIRNAMITLYSYADTSVKDTVYSDINGNFAFSGLYYDIEADFDIKAHYLDHTFYANPTTVTLLDNAYTANISIKDSTGYTLSSTPLPVSNFAVTPVANLNKVNVTWSYLSVANDTTTFNIYRDDVFLATVSNVSNGLATNYVYTDLTGAPFANYIYKIEGSRLVSGQMQVYTHQDTVVFPDVAQPTTFTATPNTISGKVNLAWANANNNISGYNIYRDGNLIASLPATATTYSDFDATPLTPPSANVTYNLRAKRFVENVTYEASIPKIANALAPALPSVATIAAAANTARNSVIVTFGVSGTGLNNVAYNFDGYRVSRDGVFLGIVPKGTATTYTFEDKLGQPNSAVVYAVSPYTILSDSTYAIGTPLTKNITYPVLMAASTLAATKSSNGTAKINEVKLTWTPALDMNVANRNIDGQLVTMQNGTGEDTLAFLNAKENSYRYFTTNTAVKTYYVRSYKQVGDMKYYSVPISATGNPSSSSNVVAMPTNFKATTNLTGQTFLTWEYPNYVFSQFILYKDSIVIDTLPVGTLSYQDAAASPWKSEFYQIEALNGGIVSQRIGVVGQTASSYILSGRVYSNNTKMGLPGVDIYATATNFARRAKTDSTGYYQIAIPSQPNLSITVMADAFSAAYTQFIAPYSASDLAAVQTVLTSENDETYSVNFISSFAPAALDVESPASIEYVQASPNPAQSSVSITWSASNTDYDGVEVYRAATLLATVPKTSAAIVWDSTGVPGISYTYQVRTYKMVSNETVYGAYAGMEATFPVLNTPAYFQSYNLANGFRLEWGHDWNNHTKYVLTRDGEEVATILPGEKLAYEDFSGIPSKNYIYKVSAVKTINGVDYASEPATLMLTYPDITEVSDVSLTIPTQTVTGLISATGCGINATRTQNRVFITWTYPSDNADGFLVYRDDKIIGTLPHDSLSFNDYTALPDVVYDYKVQSLRKIDSLVYNSVGLTTTGILYPTLAAPYNLQLKDTLGMLRYRWFYPETNIKGFMVKIYQGTNLIDTDTVIIEAGKNSVFTYYHSDGTPNVQYRYEAIAYDVRSGTAYYSAASQCASNYNASGTLTGYGWTLTTYPNPLPPTAFNATDGTYDSYVKLTWTYSADADITGFELYKNGSYIGEVVKGQREYNHLEFMASTPFSARAYRLINGIRYYSTYATSNNGNSKPLLTALTGSGRFGYSFDAHENMIAVGEPDNSIVRQYVQNAQGTWATGWVHSGSGGLGTSVALTTDMMISVAPTALNPANVLKFNGTSITYTGSFFPPNTAEAPTTTAISDLSISTNSYGIVNTHPIGFGIPDYATNDGAVYIDVYGNGGWLDNAAANSNERFGEGFAMNQRHAIISRPVNSNSQHIRLLDYYLANTASGASWTELGPIDLPNDITQADGFGKSLAYADDYTIAAGAPTDAGGGKVYIYKRLSAVGDTDLDPYPWTPPTAINNPTSSGNFGFSVDVQRDMVLIGNPNNDIAYLFEKNTVGQWDLIRTYSGLGGGLVGYCVKIGKHNAFIAAPYGNTVHVIPLGDVQAGTVTATKGTILNQTRIDWGFVGVEKEIAGFRIYRDGIMIGSVSNNDRFFFDDNGVAGKKYIYEVAAYHSDMEQRRYPAEGWSKLNGVLEGEVITLEGGGKVAGATIKATALIEGNYYNYVATTDGNGYYNISNVFYGGNTANYSLTATFKDHAFITNPIAAQLSSTQPAASGIQFIDKTAYTIGGYISRRNTECGLDSMKVTAYTVLTNGTREALSPVYTNPKGFYSITINPFLANLAQIEVEVAETRQISVKGVNKTLRFKFAAQSSAIFPITPDFSTVNTVDFLDTLTYPVKFNVVNACKNPLLGGQYQIRVKDEDGCYNQTFTTDNQGFVLANLPPINLTLNVEGVENLNQQTELVVNYLRYRPQVLKLYDIYRDNATVTDALTEQEFIYFTPPTIKVEQGFGRYLCNDLSKAAIVTSGKAYTLRFSVQSFYNGSFCDNKLGKIYITNAAATNQLDSLRYSDTYQPYPGAPLGGFPPYTFTAGAPNLVAPYAYTMNVEYRSKEGEILGIKNFAVIVEGTAALPGSDVVVDLGSAEQIKLPIYVLRKPPGDNSSSSIEQGTSVSYEFSNNNNVGGGVGFWGEFQFVIAGVGFKAEVESMLGRDNNSSYLGAASFTTTTAISTSGMSEKGKTKDASDVIVGTGIAAQYGLSQTIKVEDNNCKINKFTSIQFTPNSLQTTWMYTVNHIQHLVDGYKIQKTQVDKGTLVIKGNDGKAYSKAEANAKLDGYIKGWDKVLSNHRRETLPWYDLCAHELPYYLSNERLYYNAPDDLGDGDRKRYIEEWRMGYCTDDKYMPGGQYINGKFSIKKEKEAAFMAMEWNKERIRAYNSARTAIYQLEYVYPLGDGEYDYAGTFNSNKGTSGEYRWFLDNWKYEKAKLTDSTKAALLMQFAGNITHDGKPLLGGVPAKNITFSGGVEYSESQENTMGTTNASDAQFFTEITAKVGPEWETSVSTSAFVVIKEAIKTENWMGVIANFHYNYTSGRAASQDRTNTTSFTLSDDDEFDQYSVTCIQGVNPGHTPYFALLGGRSSCPQEIGAIQRDRPDIRLYDEASNSTGFHQNQYFVKEDEPAIFKVRLTNRNLFNEAREIKVSLDNTSNPDGAEVYLGGTQLGEMIFELDPEDPFDVELKIVRGASAYQYDSITLEVSPACDEDEMTVDDANLNTKITVSVFFESPCSNITLLDPEDGWQIKRRNPFVANSREELLIKFTDYDTENENLVSTRLEYRRLGANQTWTTIDGSEYEVDSLHTWDSLTFLPGAVRYYPFIWDITDNYVDFPDGEYEIRAVAECEVAGQMYSEVVRGSIFRNTKILGVPEPADRVWTTGDEISVAYIADIECALVTPNVFKVTDITTNQLVPGQVLCHNNKVTFMPTNSMRTYNGDSLRMIVKNVIDYQGNSLDSVVWTFNVVSSDMYVGDNIIDVTVEQGAKADISTFLINNREDGVPLTYSVSNLATYSTWLSSKNATGTILVGMPEQLFFTVNAATLPIDTVKAFLNVVTNGITYPNAIQVRVRVLPKSPNWVVNTSLYEQNMTVISNFILNSNQATRSTDSTDIISVWIGNEVRGVAKISRITSTIYNAIITVYGNTADANKALSFRVWDSSTGSEYDARPLPTATVPFTSNGIRGSLASPLILNVLTASDKATYIPLNKGWTMFSINKSTWNMPINTALNSLKYRTNGDIIKTANKSASFSSTTNTWTSANGLDSANVHRGYMIRLANADTLRITGAAAAIKPITLNAGWNLIGYPIQTELPIANAMVFSVANPDTMWLKTVPQNTGVYSRNMVANYYAGSWKYAFSSNMDKIRPNFAYWLKVKTNQQLRYPGFSGGAVTLLRVANDGSHSDPEYPDTWGVNPANYEHNMLIHAAITIDKHQEQDTSSLVAAFVGDECRGVGKLTYLPEEKKYVMAMFVYSNQSEGEEMEYRIYSGEQNKVYRHYEPIPFGQDSVLGSFEQTYKFSNVAPDNSFYVSAYPNPFETKFKVNIQSDKAQTFVLRLVDIAGHNLMEQSIEEESSDLNVMMNTQALRLTQGVYFLQVIGSLGETTTIKLMK